MIVEGTSENKVDGHMGTAMLDGKRNMLVTVWLRQTIDLLFILLQTQTLFSCPSKVKRTSKLLFCHKRKKNKKHL